MALSDADRLVQETQRKILALLDVAAVDARSGLVGEIILSALQQAQARPEIETQQFRDLPRYSIAGRYGGAYSCEASATGEWVRWSDVEQLVNHAGAPRERGEWAPIETLITTWRDCAKEGYPAAHMLLTCADQLEALLPAPPAPSAEDEK